MSFSKTVPTVPELDDLWAIHLGPQATAKAKANAKRLDDTRTWVDPNGYQLSDRVWQQRKEVREAISARLREGLANRESAADIAKGLEDYLDPNLKPVRMADGKILKRDVAARQGQGVYTRTPYGGAGSYPARRLARTEVTRAHGQATIHSASKTTGYLSWRLSVSHPKIDICDDHATADAGNGPGVYATQNIPTYPAHPHCLCTLIVVDVRDIGSANPRLDRINRARAELGLPPLEEDALGKRFLPGQAPATPPAPAQPLMSPAAARTLAKKSYPPLPKPTVPLSTTQQADLKKIVARIRSYRAAANQANASPTELAAAQRRLAKAMADHDEFLREAERLAALPIPAPPVMSAYTRSPLPPSATPPKKALRAPAVKPSAVTDGLDEFDHAGRAAAIKAMPPTRGAARDALTQRMDQSIKNLSKSERDALRGYTGSDYVPINIEARGLQKEQKWDYGADTKTRRIGLMENGFARDTSELVEDVKVFRGSGFKRGYPPEWKNMKPGDTITDWGFMSTSVRNDTAEGFKRLNPYFMELLLPKGSHALPVWEFSQIQSELEVLLSRGATMLVHEVKWERVPASNWQPEQDIIKIVAELIT